MDISDMKIGVPAQIVPPVDKSIRIAKKLDDLQYDTMWYVDHFMGWIPDSIWTPDLIPLAKFQPTPHTYLETFTLIAAHAAVTDQIQMGIAVTETIRRHPALMAQLMLTLDHISQGRVIFGMGAGEAENITPYGLDYAKPVSKLEENLRIIRLFLENPCTKINYKGRFWNLEDAILGLEPFNPARLPPIWLGAHGPRMLKLTAELADGWIPVSLPVAEYKKKLKTIYNETKNFNREPAEITPAHYVYTVLANDPNECLDIMTTPLGRAWVLTAFDSMFTEEGYKHPLCEILHKEHLNPFTDYIPIKLGREETIEAINKIPLEVIQKFYLHGNEETIIKALEDYYRAGCRHFVFWNFTGMFKLEKYAESNQILLNVLKYVKDSKE
ncbi:MAG: LLM class flavin-dependent oxidoreductase [Candidatus Helarchaeota archaeon]